MRRRRRSDRGTTTRSGRLAPAAMALCLVAAAAGADCPDADGDGLPGSIDGNVAVNEAAALDGECGLEILIDDDAGRRRGILIDDTPEAETLYRATFLFNPNAVRMAVGSGLAIFECVSPDPRRPGSKIAACRLTLRRLADGFYLQASARHNSGRQLSAPALFLGPPQSRDTFAVECQWQAASGATAGSFRLRVGGGPWATIDGLANDLHRIEEIRFGVLFGVRPGTAGSLYFDELASFRTPAAEP